MATELHNLSDYNPDLMPDKETIANQKYAIAVAEWNSEITDALLQGAVNSLKLNGVKEQNITIIYVPGTFELTYAASKLSKKTVSGNGFKTKNKFAAIIVLGCVIQGDTPHFDYVCSGVTQGITELNLQASNPPVIFGVLTTNTLQQAKDRAGGIHGNKGDEAAVTAIKMANIIW